MRFARFFLGLNPLGSSGLAYFQKLDIVRELMTNPVHTTLNRANSEIF